MGNASTELELDCRAAGHIFCRQAEAGFSLMGFDTEFWTFPVFTIFDS